MARRITTLIILAYGLFISVANLHSQETVSVNFRVFGAGLDDFQDLFYFDGGEYVPLGFKKTSRSVSTYEYRGAPRITIFAPNPAHRTKPLETPAFLPLASLRIDQSYPDSLLVFVADAMNRQKQKEKRSYKLFLLDDSPDAFQGNTIYTINATEIDLFGKIGAETVILSSNSIQKTDFSKFASNNKPLPIRFAFQTPEGPRLTMSNDVPLSLNRRVVLVLMNPRREGSTRINTRALIDIISPLGDDDPKLN